MAAKDNTVAKLMWGNEPHGLVLESGRVLLVSMWKFVRDRGVVRASALAFSTALSLVPLLALVFAILKGLNLQKRFEPIILDYFSANNQYFAQKVVEYVNNTQASSMGIIGVVGFFASAIMVLSNVEQAFNDIWGGISGRTLMRRLSDYTAILVACPILIILSTSMATTLQVRSYMFGLGMVESALPAVYSLLPLLTKALAFSAAYLIMPNRKVGMKAAFIGGLVAGAIFNLVEWVYLSMQIGMSGYNAIYGALAQLPMFLIWVYLGWCMVILGAEIACVIELPGMGRCLKGGEELWSPRLGAAMQLLMESARRYLKGEEPLTEEKLIDVTGLHPVEADKILAVLVSSGLLATTEKGVIPALSPDRTTVNELLRRIVIPPGPEVFVEDELKVFSGLGDSLKGVTWAQLALGQAQPPNIG